MNSFFDFNRCIRYFCKWLLIRSAVICSCFGMCSKIADGDECFKPTSNIADTKSRCKSSGHVNLLDHLPSDAFLDFFRDFEVPPFPLVFETSDPRRFLLPRLLAGSSASSESFPPSVSSLSADGIEPTEGCAAPTGCGGAEP